MNKRLLLQRNSARNLVAMRLRSRLTNLTAKSANETFNAYPSGMLAHHRNRKIHVRQSFTFGRDHSEFDFLFESELSDPELPTVTESLPHSLPN